LEAAPYRFDFFQAVRQLENLRRDLPKVGCSLSPAQDFVRFGQKPSLTFAPSTIETIEVKEDRVKLFVRFMGLFGPNAPLPPHLTEYAYERLNNEGDPTLAAFVDVFHHRMLSLFYRAWSVHRQAVDLDRAEESRYRAYVGSLCGLGMESLQDGDEVSDSAKLFFCGRLAGEPQSAEGLEAILSQDYDIPVEIQSLVGRWLVLPPDARCRLGQSLNAGTLGRDAIVGSKIWDCQLSFRVRMGPMRLEEYQRLLPGGKSFRRLEAWVLNYLGDAFFWDVQYVLRAAEVPATCLGHSGELGWTAWLKSRSSARDREDLVVEAGHPLSDTFN